MLQSLVAKMDLWLTRWSQLIWPGSRSERGTDTGNLTPFEFFLGNELGAYISVLLASFLYFAIFHRTTLARRLTESGASLLASASAMFAVYAVLSFMTVLVGAAISYTVYRSVGSNAEFSRHVGSFLELTFLEPVASFAVTLMILTASPTATANGQIPSSVWAIIGLFVATRLYYLLVGRRLMKTVHELAAPKQRLAFGVGFVPAFILINILFLGIAWIFAVVAVIGAD